MRLDIAIATGMIVIGAYGIFEMSTLPELRGDHVGPALYPLTLSVALIVLSAAFAAHTVISKRRVARARRLDTAPRGMFQGFIRVLRSRPGVLFLVALGYGALFEHVGFPTLTVLTITVLSYMLEPTDILRKVLFATGVTVAVWLVFATLLGLPLPPGRFLRLL